MPVYANLVTVTKNSPGFTLVKEYKHNLESPDKAHIFFFVSYKVIPSNNVNITSKPKWDQRFS